MADQDATESKGQAAAVYVGWTTFKNCIIDGLSEGLPNVIDKSVFPGQSGAVQSQIMAGLKFLGLIDADGRPMKTLHDLTVPDEGARKQALAGILKARYSDLFALGIEKATMNQLSETMAESYFVNGDTKEKAIRFFLAAAGYAEIQLSRHLAAKNSGITAQRKRTSTRRTAEQNGGAAAPLPPPPPPSIDGTSRTVTLASGGTLTLIINANMLKLKDDRAFVFGLIDALDEYESKNSVEGEEDDDEESES